MKYCIAFILFLPFFSAQAQPAAQEALDNSNLTLHDRYESMKTKSQTYGDYKVIKEYILDGVWKISIDSIRANKVLLRGANTTISTLQTEVSRLQAELQQKEASMEEIVTASTHISVMGIDVDKSLFKVIAGLTFVGLLVLLGLMTGKLKLMYLSIREKMELITITSSEFESYKKKALERQTRLSRELQTERNKLMELKRG